MLLEILYKKFIINAICKIIFMFYFSRKGKVFSGVEKFIDQLSLYPEIYSSFSLHMMPVLGTPCLITDTQVPFIK